MDRLSDALADHAEIERALSIGGELSQQASTLAPIDEDELDAELERLLQTETAEVSPFPQVPSEAKPSRLEKDASSVEPVQRDRVAAS